MNDFGEMPRRGFTTEISGSRFRSDVQVAALAGHSLVEKSVRWLASVDDRAVQQECREGMIQQLSLAMEVPREIGDRAFRLCGRNLGIENADGEG